MSELFITEEGKAEKEARLRYLKNEKRPEVLEKLKVARDFGDLSENSEYDAAKEEQAQVEQEIAEIEEKLRHAQIINQKKVDTSKVSAGCFVKLLDLDFDDTFEYQIMGSTESDPAKGIISNESPVGQALMGKKKGETVEVILPENNSKIRLKVLDIHA